MQNDFTVENFWREFQSYKTDFIPADFSPSKVDLYDVIDSTNSELLRRIENLRLHSDSDVFLTEVSEKIDRTLVASGSQTAGRGRIGRRFYSPDKTGIYFSLAYIPKSKPINPACVTAASSVAVSRAIENVFGVETKIKWVNDVYVGEKKVSGILVEGFCDASGSLSGFIIGIGINISMEKSEGANWGKAGGIIDCSKNPDAYRNSLLAASVKEVLSILDRDEKFIDEYRAKSFLKGKTVSVTPLVGNELGVYDALVLDVTDDAGLLVRLEDGSEKVLSSGEVSLHQ